MSYRMVKILVRIEKLLYDIEMNTRLQSSDEAQTQEEELLNAAEVMQRLKISSSTLYRYKKHKILEPTALDGKFYRLADVIRHKKGD